MPERRAVGYVRVSSVRGREGDDFHSPELQRQAIEDGARRHGYELIHVYEELDVSGRSGVHRPVFERMMDDARAGHFEAVIVAKLTRFGRSARDALNNIGKLDELNVALVAIDNDVAPSTPTGKFTRNVMLNIAEMESDRISEEWRAVHAHRRERGIAHVPSGLYGYTVEGAAIAGIDEKRAPAIRLAFELRDGGAGYGEIAKRLNALDFPPIKGDRLSPKTVAKWLRNPHYAGLVRLPGGELIEAAHEPLVASERWDRVQALHGTVNRQARFRAGLLSGVLVCSGCHYSLERKDGERDGPRYGCPSSKRVKACPCQVTIGAEQVERYVTDVLLLSRFKLDDDSATRTRLEIEQLDREDEQLDAALDRLADALGSGAMQADEYERQARRQHAKREKLTERRRELQASLGRASDVLDEDGRVTVDWQSMELDERRGVVRELAERIVVHPSARQGGSRSRGIDFAQRLSFEWKLPAVESAIFEHGFRPLIEAIERGEELAIPVSAFTGSDPLAPFPGALEAMLAADPTEAAEGVETHEPLPMPSELIGARERAAGERTEAA
jgi:DNA invertase Pin-like site-specific DNA recombinase